MKKLILLAVLFYSVNSFAQVGIGTNTPNAKSVLELKSTTQGFLPPRMTPSERATAALTIPVSATGLLVEDSATGTPYIWTGTTFLSYAASATYPLTVTNGTNTIYIYPGSSAGQLLRWNGSYWNAATVSNEQPYLGMNFCIALSGIFPSRSAYQPYLGEVDIYAFTFAPVGWAECDGQIMSIAQNTALFSLLGTTYGGDGYTTFALPNLQGRVPVHFGTPSGGANYISQGQVGGSEYLQ